jgi:hypothetical protein
LKILSEYRIPYGVEASFPDWLSEKGNPLRFDFAILNESGDIKCLIECQGEQHYKIGGGYGGYANLNARQCVMNKSENTLKRISFRLLKFHIHAIHMRKRRVFKESRNYIIMC